jgi:hypothetical protein
MITPFVAHSNANLDLKVECYFNAAIIYRFAGFSDIVIQTSLCYRTCRTCSGPLATDCILCPVSNSIKKPDNSC